MRNFALINVSELLLTETAKDPILNALRDVIYVGWLANIKELPTHMRPYWSFRYEFAVEGGIMF